MQEIRPLEYHELPLSARDNIRPFSRAHRFLCLGVTEMDWTPARYYPSTLQGGADHLRVNDRYFLDRTIWSDLVVFDGSCSNLVSPSLHLNRANVHWTHLFEFTQENEDIDAHELKSQSNRHLLPCQHAERRSR